MEDERFEFEAPKFYDFSREPTLQEIEISDEFFRRTHPKHENPNPRPREPPLYEEEEDFSEQRDTRRRLLSKRFIRKSKIKQASVLNTSNLQPRLELPVREERHSYSVGRRGRVHIQHKCAAAIAQQKAAYRQQELYLLSSPFEETKIASLSSRPRHVILPTESQPRPCYLRPDELPQRNSESSPAPSKQQGLLNKTKKKRLHQSRASSTRVFSIYEDPRKNKKNSVEDNCDDDDDAATAGNSRKRKAPRLGPSNHNTKACRYRDHNPNTSEVLCSNVKRSGGAQNTAAAAAAAAPRKENMRAAQLEEWRKKRDSQKQQQAKQKATSSRNQRPTRARARMAFTANPLSDRPPKNKSSRKLSTKEEAGAEQTEQVDDLNADVMSLLARHNQNIVRKKKTSSSSKRRGGGLRFLGGSSTSARRQGAESEVRRIR
eukprot:jgi/Bigna1/81887/fgenesh1_pg.85_\